MKWLMEFVNRSDHIIAVLLGTEVLIIFYNTLVRYLPVSPEIAAWPEEIGRLIFIWIVFLSAGSATLKNEHFRLDLLFRRQGRKLQKAIGIVSDSVVVATLVVLFIASMRSVWMLRTLRYPGILELPVMYFYLAVAVGCLLMCVYTFAILVQLFKMDK